MKKKIYRILSVLMCIQICSYCDWNACTNCSRFCDTSYEQCGRCEGCADWFCADCERCKECVFDLRCEGCGACASCTSLICPDCYSACSRCSKMCADTTDCGRCESCGGKICTKCEKCSACTDSRHCEKCGHCAKCETLCLECEKVCDNCAKFCPKCHTCHECADDYARPAGYADTCSGSRYPASPLQKHNEISPCYRITGRLNQFGRPVFSSGRIRRDGSMHSFSFLYLYTLSMPRSCFCGFARKTGLRPIFFPCESW